MEGISSLVIGMCWFLPNDHTNTLESKPVPMAIQK